MRSMYNSDIDCPLAFHNAIGPPPCHASDGYGFVGGVTCLSSSWLVCDGIPDPSRKFLPTCRGLFSADDCALNNYGSAPAHISIWYKKE